MNLINYLRNADKTPAQIILLAALSGIFIGLLGVLFQLGVDYISHIRMTSVKNYFSDPWQMVAAVFSFSALLSMFAYYIVHKYSPESGGSGIPEIEGALQDLRPVRWWRVLPVKFFGGLGSLGSGMVLGREGPTVQLGSNLAEMVSAIFKVKKGPNRHILLASGAAAGLSVAFNAPLASIVFIIEEMREEFKYSFTSIKAVVIATIMATVVFRLISGSAALLEIGIFGSAVTTSLWLFAGLGIVIGALGLLYNHTLLFLQDRFLAFYQGKTYRFVLAGGLIGGSCGVIALFMPEFVGEGFNVIHAWAKDSFPLQMILLFLVVRFLTSIISFSSGAPGGVFSPLLALGTLMGALYGGIVADYFPHYELNAGMFAVAGMGALFAATVRAPLTGTLLVLELTDNFALILPMLITCLGATIIAQLFGGKPLYTTLLKRTIARDKQKQAAEEEKEKMEIAAQR